MIIIKVIMENRIQKIKIKEYSKNVFSFLISLIIMILILSNVNSIYQHQIQNYIINSEEIIIKINKKGDHYILSSYYNNCPDEIYINDIPYTFAGTNCQLVTLEEERNTIKLKWTEKVTTCDNMFFGCSTIDEIDLSNFDTSSVISMITMFRICHSLTSINLSNKFTTKNVQNTKSMFYNCTSLSSIDLSNFITTSVNCMSYMFNGCLSLTSLDLSSFDTSNVQYMNYMFRYCQKLTSLNLSNFNTMNTYHMGDMFHGCLSLVSLDLSSFDITKVMNISSMFYNCKNLEYIKIIKGTEYSDLLMVDTLNNVPENIVFF